MSTTGFVLMVSGAVLTIILPPAGSALMSIGKGISLGGMFIDNVYGAIDDVTDADALTGEEAKDLALETGFEVATYMVGKGIGKSTNVLNDKVTSKLLSDGTNKVFSLVAGQTAETLTDTTLSLGADFVLTEGYSLLSTGEFIPFEDYWSIDRFKSEGANM